MVIYKNEKNTCMRFKTGNYWKQTNFSVKYIQVLFTCSLLLSITPAFAQVACPANPHWSATVPPINMDHVFCGEIKNNNAKGFHSRPNGINPATVVSFVKTQEENVNGIYGGIVTLINPGGPNPSKYSSIFPDSCSQGQVVESILYSYSHQQACPPGAPVWATCGVNRPQNSDSAKYCVGNDVSSQFYIAFALLANGDINTAFPLL